MSSKTKSVMDLSGHTKPFAVFGHPIGHSLSPAMHNASIGSLGMDAIYLAFDVHPDRLMQVLPTMADMGFGGVNLTVPLKEVAFRGLTDLDKSARDLGAVNTVEFVKDGIRGHNTDGYGVLKALEEAFGADVAGLNVFVLGTGGAGRAVAITLAVAGAGRIALADIDDERTGRVAEEIKALAPDCATIIVGADKADWVSSCAEADLVIQATPVGMKPEDESLLPAEAFKADQAVFDLVYMFPETAFMKTAVSAGASCANGLGMLLHQGARAFEIWSGVEPDVEAMRRALEERVYGK